MQGRNCYSQFKKVIKLEGSNRLEEEEHKAFYEAFLSQLRNGEVTLEVWSQFVQLTSEEHHVVMCGSREAFNHKFNGPQATHYYNTNKEILSTICECYLL
jgi:23S rRNA G2445 N2-methylase RlmL